MTGSKALSHNWTISGFIDELIEYGNIQPEEIYLTNQKKCSNVGNDPFEGAEAEARQRCMEYL